MAAGLDRASYRREVERLLDQIRRGVGDVRRLKVSGVRGRALADRKQEIDQAREQLARLVEAAR